MLPETSMSRSFARDGGEETGTLKTTSNVKTLEELQNMRVDMDVVDIFVTWTRQKGLEVSEADVVSLGCEEWREAKWEPI